MNPEPMHTGREKAALAPQPTLEEPVFMGSGFGPTDRPGMTGIISSQALGTHSDPGQPRRMSATAAISRLVSSSVPTVMRR